LIHYKYPILFPSSVFFLVLSLKMIFST